MTDIRDRTDIEYREAPPAVDFGSLTTAVGTAPPGVPAICGGHPILDWGPPKRPTLT